MLPTGLRRVAFWGVVAAVAVASPWGALAQAPAAPDALSAPWTLQGRDALRARLGAGLFTVRRRLEPPPGFVTPAPLALLGVATCMADGSLWTSASLVEGLPKGPTSGGLTVEAASGPAEVQGAEVARVDAALGMASLRLVGPNGRPAECSPGQVARSPAETGGLLLGRVVYAAVPGDPRLRTTTVQGPGRDPFAWFLAAEGDPLPPGTPVFDAAGRWLSLAGPQAPEAPTRAHLLPDQAVADWLSGGAPPAESPR